MEFLNYSPIQGTTVFLEKIPDNHLRYMKPWNPANTGIFTPWKINMDHNHGGLEDHFPF